MFPVNIAKFVRASSFKEHFQWLLLITHQITRSLVSFGHPSYYIGSNILFYRRFWFRFCKPDRWKSTQILLNETEKKWRKVSVKSFHSLNSITWDDNGAYTQRRTTKTNKQSTKSNPTKMNIQIVHKNDRGEYFKRWQILYHFSYSH